MAEIKTYWQMITYPVRKLTNGIINALTNITTIFYGPSPNAVCQHVKQGPHTKSATRVPPPAGMDPATLEFVDKVVYKYRCALAQRVRIKRYPCLSIFPTAIDFQQEELRKFKMEAVKTENEMFLNALTVARLKIKEMTLREQELEAKVVQLAAALKLTEQPELTAFDAEKFSYDFSDIRCEEEQPERFATQAEMKLMLSPRSFKSRIPRPIPGKPKQQQVKGPRKTYKAQSARY